MNFTEIAKNYSKEKRKMMTDAVIKNQNHKRNFPSYHTQSLNTMFAEWHILFPTQKQDIHCTSCRAAICKFWEMVSGEWNKKQTKKKTNAKKKTKTNKQKAK
jgi:hypothetical protein